MSAQPDASGLYFIFALISFIALISFFYACHCAGEVAKEARKHTELLETITKEARKRAELLEILVKRIADRATSSSAGKAAAFLFCMALLATSAFAQAPAKVTIYRPKRFIGSGLTPSVYVDQRQIARLDNGRYFIVALPPGKHVFSSSMKHAPLELEIHEGETVYIEMIILAGTWRGGGRLIPTPEDDAKGALMKLKPLDAKWIVAREMLWRPEP